MSAIVLEKLVYEITGKRILKEVDLTVETGEIISIMGQSGSGKTTLLKLMTGLLRATSGKILIDGEDIAGMREQDLDRVRLKMGLVFQYAALFDSLSVHDNIVFGVVRHRKETRPAALDRIVKDLLGQVQLEGIEKQFPSELSGGMQKRVGLARALAMEPKLIFYDEPTSGLDPVTGHAIDELILQTRDRLGVTSVVVSHHLPSVFRISDRVAMLYRGEIIAFGKPDAVLNSSDPRVKEFIAPDREGFVKR